MNRSESLANKGSQLHEVYYKKLQMSFEKL